jgi:hypothetical protein
MMMCGARAHPLVLVAPAYMRACLSSSLRLLWACFGAE